MASFLRGHGEKQRVLPPLVIIQTAGALKEAVNACRRVAHSLCVALYRHIPNLPLKGWSYKSKWKRGFNGILRDSENVKRTERFHRSKRVTEERGAGV